MDGFYAKSIQEFIGTLLDALKSAAKESDRAAYAVTAHTTAARTWLNGNNTEKDCCEEKYFAFGEKAAVAYGAVCRKDYYVAARGDKEICGIMKDLYDSVEESYDLGKRGNDVCHSIVTDEYACICVEVVNFVPSMCGRRGERGLCVSIYMEGNKGHTYKEAWEVVKTIDSFAKESNCWIVPTLENDD